MFLFDEDNAETNNRGKRVDAGSRFVVTSDSEAIFSNGKTSCVSLRLHKEDSPPDDSPNVGYINRYKDFSFDTRIPVEYLKLASRRRLANRATQLAERMARVTAH